jgi:DNA cross-link repair 1C protein
MFEAVLSPLGATRSIPPTPTNGGDLDLLLVQVDEEGDAAVKNVVGSSDLAQRWAERAKLRSKLQIMVGYLDPERKSFLDKLLRLRPDSPLPELHTSKVQASSPSRGEQRDFDRDSEDGSDDVAAEDDHWRTAHMFFGSSTSAQGERFKWAFSSPKSPSDGAVSEEQDTEAFLMPQLSPIRQVVNDHPLQGRMLHAGNMIVRPAEDKPFTPQSGKPKTGVSASRKRAGSPLLVSSNRPTTTNKLGSPFRSRCQHGIRGPSSSAVQDENIFVQDPDARTSPDRSVSLGHVHQALKRSPRRLVASTSSPDMSGGAATSDSKPKKTSLTISKRKQRVERTLKSLQLADRLARANPGRVASTYREKRARLLKECVRNEVKNQYLEGLENSGVQNIIPDPHFDHSLSQFESVAGSQMEIDWDRSRQIAQQVRTELAGGQWPVFPSLACTESQPTAD